MYVTWSTSVLFYPQKIVLRTNLDIIVLHERKKIISNFLSVFTSDSVLHRTKKSAASISRSDRGQKPFLLNNPQDQGHISDEGQSNLKSY